MTIDSGNLVEISALVIYLVLLLVIGLGSVTKSRTAIDYTLAGRNIPWYIVLATTAATMVGGGLSIGVVTRVYQTGVGAALVACGSYLSLVVSGLFLAPKLRDLEMTTVGDYFEYRFGLLARSLAAPICVVFLLGAIAAQMVAVGLITNVVLGIDYRTAVLIGAVVTVFYSTVGGLRAVIRTDILQFGILVGGFTAAAIPLVGNRGPADLTAVTGGVLNDQWSLTRIVTLGCVYFLGEMLVPPFAQRCFMAKNGPSAKWGVAGAGLLLLLFMPLTTSILGTACQGSSEIEHAVEVAGEAQVAFPTLMRNVFHPVFSGIMVAALIAAVMSSADSCLSSLATISMEDLYRRHLRKDASDRQLLRVAQGTTLLAGIGCAVAALYFRNILDWIEFIYSVWGPTMVLPFFVGVLWYKPSRVYACVLAMFGGFSATLFWNFGAKSVATLFDPEVSQTVADIPPALVGFLVCFVVFLVAWPLTQNWRQSRLVTPRPR